MTIANHISDDVLVIMMDEVRDICSAANQVRGKHNIRNRQPLSNMDIISQNGKFSYLAFMPQLVDIIKDECNVKQITLIDEEKKGSFMTTEPKHTPTRFADQTELRNWLSSVVRLEYNSIENRYKFPSNDLHDLLVVMNTRHEPLTGLVCEAVWLLERSLAERQTHDADGIEYEWATRTKALLTKAKALQPASGVSK
jgi:isoleucyl-tRNA synthetase